MVTLEMLPTVITALVAGAAIVAVAVAGVPRGITGVPLDVPLPLIGALATGAAMLGVLAAVVTDATGAARIPRRGDARQGVRAPRERARRRPEPGRLRRVPSPITRVGLPDRQEEVFMNVPPLTPAKGCFAVRGAVTSGARVLAAPFGVW